MFQQFRYYDKQCQMQPFETSPSHTDICPIMHGGFDVFDFINRIFSLKLFLYPIRIEKKMCSQRDSMSSLSLYRNSLNQVCLVTRLSL